MSFGDTGSPSIDFLFGNMSKYLLSPSVSISLSNCKINSRILMSINAINNIDEIDLANSGIDDSLVSMMHAPESLTYLSLAGSPITDDSIYHFKNCHELREIDLHGTSITSKCMTELSELPRLEYLEISSTKIDASAVGDILRMEHLVEIGLSNTLLTNQSIGDLSTHSGIKSISLSGTLISNDSFAAFLARPLLRKMIVSDTNIGHGELLLQYEGSNLNELWLGGTSITDHDLFQILEKHRRIRHLYLRDTLVTNRVCIQLSNMPALKTLSVAGTQIDNDGLLLLAKSKTMTRLSISNDTPRNIIGQIQKISPRLIIKY